MSLVSRIAKQSLYPLEPCVQFDKPDRRWLEPLASDAVFLHTMISTAEDFFLMLTGTQNHGASECPANRDAHFSKALRLLRERLLQADNQDALSDNTICVILCLASTARGFGDYEAALFHMAGLRKMVDLRGGLENIRRSPKLLIDLLR